MLYPKRLALDGAAQSRAVNKGKMPLQPPGRIRLASVHALRSTHLLPPPLRLELLCHHLSSDAQDSNQGYGPNYYIRDPPKKRYELLIQFCLGLEGYVDFIPIKNGRYALLL